MKMIDRIMVVLMMLSMPVGAMAENTLDRAINYFVNSKDAKNYITGEYDYDERNMYDTLTTRYKKYTFTVKKSNRDFERLHEVFINNRSKGYNAFMKKAGVISDNIQRVAYGADGSKTVEFGTHKDRNYLMIYIRDPKRENLRTVYALVWYNKTFNKNTIEGTLHVISGRDPQKSGRTIQTTTYNPNTSTTITVLEDGTVVKTDNNGNRTVFNKANNSITHKTTKIDGDDKAKPESATEFMQKFSTYRSLYINIAEKQEDEYRTSILNKMLDLCKNYSSLLNNDEVGVCIIGLKKMQELTYDEYQKALLNLTVKALKR